MKQLILWTFFVVIPLHSFADPEQEKAMLEVQKEMKDPKSRQQMMTTPQAKKTDEYVKQMTGGGQNEQEIYNISSDILMNMKDMTPEQMDAYLRKAQENPEDFANSLTPEQLKKIKALSEKIPAANQKRP